MNPRGTDNPEGGYAGNIAAGMARSKGIVANNKFLTTGYTIYIVLTKFL